MKKLTAVLLAIIVTVSACAAPAGNNGSGNGGSGNGGGSTAETEQAAEGDPAVADSTESDTTEAYIAEGDPAETESSKEEFLGPDEGFVPAQESEEEIPEEEAAQEEETAQEETEELYEEEEFLSDLVILEEGEENYRAAANRKSAKVTDAVSSTLRATGMSGENTANVSEKKDYTVMVYIVGSNLESRYGSATGDIAEMRQAGLDYEKNNLLVYTGGSKRWVSDIPSTSNNVLDLSKDRSEGILANNKERIVASTEASADMGIPQTLSEFVNYCTANYPAEHYGLILWNHGGGPLWGYGSDELFKNDSLLLEELRSAMEATAFGRTGSDQRNRDQTGQPLRLDWVGFDACLMGGIENAKLWKDYADYLVGSEELEPGKGWDYSFLSVLNETSDPERIVSGIVDSYGSYYEKSRSQFFNPEVTLSALDLAKTDEVVEAADGLFAAMTADIKGGRYALLNQARSRTKAFGLSAADSKAEACDLVDLRDLAAKTGEMFPEESDRLAKAVDGMVVNSASNVEGAGGVSVYVPGDNRELYEVAQELYTQEDMISAGYEEFVSAYTDAWFAGSDTDWRLAELKKENGEWTLQLTPEQAQNASEFCYSVLFRNGWGDYQIATCNIRIDADENNVLHVPGDPLLLTAETDLQESSNPWACYQISDSDGESVYKTARTILSSGHEFSASDESIDEEVSISVKNVNGERDTTIQDVISASGGVSHSGKGSIDVSGFRSIVDQGGKTICPVRDENGQMMPYSEWEYKGYLYYQLAIDDSFRFFMKPASEFAIDCICQVTVRDVNGNLHGTDFVDLDLYTKDEHTKAETEKGTLYFDVKEDHAVLISYSGADSLVTVPDTVSGKPVTVVGKGAFSEEETITSIVLPDSVGEIGANAFAGTAGLEQIHLPAGLRTIGMAAFRDSAIGEIDLPEGLEKIGRAAFLGCGLESVELPASLQETGSAPFARCEKLTEIKVSDGNPNYKSVDGVLYTKDGASLIQYPYGKDEVEYTVEEGTAEIGYGAFARAPLQKVNFPQTLVRIDNDAFFECYTLTSLELPDSLEQIGSMAFGRDREKEGPSYRPHLESVRIGPNVSFIGSDAFTALEIGGFEVIEANAVYASSGGFITNKAGDLIQTVPMGMEDAVIVPDGITTLQSGLFTLLDEETEFYIPDSTFRFSENVFPYVYGTSKETGKLVNVYHCTLHCTENSAAWEYAAKYGIARDSNADPALRVCEEVTEEGEQGTWYWRVFGDRAELYAFDENENGNSDILEIPSDFRGLPVTALRSDQEAVDRKINSSWIKKLVIPETVRTINPEFLAGHSLIEEFEVSTENPAYKSIEGVLLTGDGKTLVSYPGYKRGEEYVIPDGVKTLGEDAFNFNRYIKKVTMPSSLRVISDGCFFSCRGLREVVFNKGLKEICDHAFSYVYLENVQLPSSVEWIGAGAFTLHKNFGDIVLPDQLKRTGQAAFEAKYGETFTQEVIRIPAKFEMEFTFLERVLFERYEVDPKSSFYKEQDGLLMSKDGRELVSVPTLMEGDLYVPEGTLAINFYALHECNRITDIYLPDSLLDIGSLWEKDYKTGKHKYTVHCHEGTEAQKKLEKTYVPWVPIEDSSTDYGALY